jgi:hypothetical protein
MGSNDTRRKREQAQDKEERKDEVIELGILKPNKIIGDHEKII